MQRYLALDAIQPGDAILSAVPTASSYAIRAVTGSRAASHVALAIHPLIWFEAIGEGIDYKIIQPELVWDGNRLRVGLKIPPGTSFTVRRPVAGLCGGGISERAEIAKQLIAITSTFAFLDYARPEAFLPLLRLGLGKTAFARKLAKRLNGHPSTIFAGPFCSWLVVACYEAMGHQFFPKSANRISPAAIARSSRFCAVSATVDGQVFDRRTAFERPRIQLEQAAKLAALSIKSVSAGARLAKGVTSFNHRLRKMLKGFWRAEGKPLPAQNAAALHSIQGRQQQAFREAQASLIAKLELAASNLSAHIESVLPMGACRDRCAKSLSGASPCGHDDCDPCRRSNEAFSAALEEIAGDLPSGTA